MPLDCEWIWHCYRLNPVDILIICFLVFSMSSCFYSIIIARPCVFYDMQVRYAIDCRHLFGRILDTQNVLSFVEGPCSKQTEAIWNNLYPNEPYELDVAGGLTKSDDGDIIEALRSTKYDLVAAVRRQSSFFKQVNA